MKSGSTPLIVIFFLMAVISASAQESLARLKLKVRGNGQDQVPVSIDLDAITKLRRNQIELYKLNGDKATPLEFQIEETSPRRLWWIVVADGEEQVFSLVKGESKTSEKVSTKDKDGSIVISSGGKNLLAYRFEMMPVPEGVKPTYQRSGFIHPLWSPKGQVLTRIQPKDHYHHYGIWNPWTHTLYKGDTVDFWNIGNGKATVRFGKSLSQMSGPVFGGYSVLHEHVVLKNPEDIAMTEAQSVRIFHPSEDAYVLDITSKLKCASNVPIVLLEYRYGGLGWRTTEQWDNKNSEVITSEGKSRKEADGSKARWCIIQGTVDNVVAGAIMMSHPANYNHPEPLRIWPENQYNRGDMFANFSPTKDKDWPLEPGKEYVLNYRLLVFNNTMTKERAEQAWQHYANPPVVHVTLHSK
jgi:hypothetical protein